MEHISNYTFFIALAITLCSLAVAVFSFLYYRKVKKECYVGLVRSIHEQERAKRELERTRIEKEAIEKVLKACLSEVVESSPAKAMPEGCMAGSGKHVMRIDITYLGQNRAASKTNNIQYQPNKQN